MLYNPQHYPATKPTITLHNPADGLETEDKTLIFNWTPTDAIDKILTCSLDIDGNIQKKSSPSGKVTKVKQTLKPGKHTWKVICEDEVKNKETSSTREFTIKGEITTSESTTTQELVSEESKEEDTNISQSIETKTVDTLVEVEEEKKETTTVPTRIQDQGPSLTSQLMDHKWKIAIGAIILAVLIVIGFGMKAYARENVLFKAYLRKWKYRLFYFWNKYIRRKQNQF